jgi:class 3 adenylate cyclase/tetratricopeptide (TPR) repeat protein
VRCTQCQHANPAGARFCNACGAALAAACAACGHPNPAGARFCSECGRALGGGSASAGPERSVSPQAFIPAHLADRILASRHALEGERKQVTVLFADLKGSMELLADRDPEEARSVLDPVLERMMEAVHRYEGTVNQVMGDGIMALFGAPVAHEDHAVRACYAALAMQEAIRRYTAEARRAHGVEIQIRVGLNSGEVVVRAIGNDLRMDYSAVGQTTHLAARMEQLASPGSIRLTAETLRLAEGFVQVVPLGPVPVKGLPEPVEVFELTGTAARTRLQAAVTRGLTRFVGRDQEMDQLREALERARAGRGQLVAAVGEPGVGKSRLFWELLHSHRTRDWLILEASSFSYGKATAFLPLADLLRTYFQLESGDDSRRVREKVTGKVLTLDEALHPVLPAVMALLDAPVEDAEWTALDAGRQRERIVDAVRALLLRESRIQPLILVFEDLHWVDSGTQAFLEGLVESLPAARILLLVNFRPEYRHPWGGRTYYTQLRLDPLPPARAEELLASLVGDDPGLGSLKRLLTERTEGNPFFLEESVRTLAETGVLVGERGGYRLAKDIEGVRMPATVQAVLAARIDRLAPEDKALLQTAAVIGGDVPFGLLRALAELPEPALRTGLARLRDGEFVYETALFPEAEYTFNHALTHEVAYASLLQERRRALHARVVEVFEALYPERVGEQANWLAHHAFRGEIWGKAVGYLKFIERAPRVSLDAVVGGPESPGYLWWTGEHERAVRTALREAAIAADFRHFEGAVVATFRLGQAYHSLGEYPRAVEFLRQSLAPLDGELLRERLGMAGLPSVFARAWLASCLAEQGEFQDALGAGEEAIQIAEAADHPYSLIVACYGLGTTCLVSGDLPRAVAVLERGLAQSEVSELPLLFPLVAAPLGAAYALTGKPSRGLELLDRAVERARGNRWLANEPLRLAWLGQAALLAGERERAAQLAGLALETARQHKERGHEAYALRLMGEVAGPEDTARADECLQQARRIADELGMRPLAARCALDLGRVSALAGQKAAAAVHLAQAAEMFREMGMRQGLAEAEAALARCA